VKKVVGITGAAGYLGGRLIQLLNRQPWVEQIVALDLKPMPPIEGVISHQLDTRDSSALRAVLVEHGVTHLVHGAFHIVPPDGDIQKMRLNNVQGSLDVFRCALNLVEHLTFISSVSVYGYHNNIRNPVTESGRLLPTMEYARHKLQAESALRILRHLPYPEGLKTQTAVIRFSAIVGPEGAKFSSLRALTANPVFIVADGGAARTQALHEDDAAALVAAVLQRNAEGVFHGAPDDDASWAEIGRLSSRPVISLPRVVLNQMTRLNHILPPLEGFTRDVVDLFSNSLVADNAQTRARLEWQPRYTTCDSFYEMFKALGTAR
jgi:UDP-glucose 4-epimerase